MAMHTGCGMGSGINILSNEIGLRSHFRFHRFHESRFRIDDASLFNKPDD